jgi:hypothetical protein
MDITADQLTKTIQEIKPDIPGNDTIEVKMDHLILLADNITYLKNHIEKLNAGGGAWKQNTLIKEFKAKLTMMNALARKT